MLVQVEVSKEDMLKLNELAGDGQSIMEYMSKIIHAVAENEKQVIDFIHEQAEAAQHFESIMQLVANMREAQTAYFKDGRKQSDLRRAKSLETQVDAMIKTYKDGDDLQPGWEQGELI